MSPSIFSEVAGGQAAITGRASHQLAVPGTLFILLSYCGSYLPVASEEKNDPFAPVCPLGDLWLIF